MADQSCCGQSSSCCCNSKKKIKIDFLYLDLNVCERCQGTETNLDGAIKEISTVLEAAGFELQVNKVNINSSELAYEYEFISSPTIRINGQDIVLEVKESSCKECGDLCGDDVDCRVWNYEGIDYTEPPKEMIINAILKVIYSGKNTDSEGSTKEEKYELPTNLKHFFELMEKKKAH